MYRKTPYSQTAKIILVLCVIFSLSAELSLAQFTTLKPGFERGELKLQTGLLVSELVAIRINPKLWDVTAYQSKIVKSAVEVCNETNSAAVINANFFGRDLKPLGLVISNSSQLHPIQLGGRTLTGVFTRSKDGDKIIHRDKFQISKEMTQAIQAGPRLIEDGQPISIPEDAPTRRSAIAIDSAGRILLFASKDRFPGLSLKDLQEILMRRELQIKDALNLDGGSSSQLYVSPSALGKEINISGGDKVPVFLVVQKTR